MQYGKWKPVLAAACVFAGLAGLRSGPSAAQEMPRSPTGCPDPCGALQGPVLSKGQAPPQLAPAQPRATDRPLPINLATALRLAGARPIVIAAAQASVQVASAQLERAKVAWLPTIYLGAGYYRHDGATEGQSGNYYVNSKDQFMAGGGVAMIVSSTDAIFAPLAARQVLRAREIDVQAACNDALKAVAEAYFNVQQARSRLAGLQDVVDKGRQLGEKVRAVEKGSLSLTNLSRARTTLAEYEEAVTLAREQWRVASADLTQALRLDPTALIIPLEPPYLYVTLISPQERVDDLIPIGLTSRPELASQQALVQAALARMRQERLRPLLPSVLLHPTGNSASGLLTDGVFASGVHGMGNPTGVRNDFGVEVVWTLDNLGLGNRALVRQRRAEQQQALVELFHIQDVVAAEIVRAHAGLESATDRAASAETRLQDAQRTYTGSLEELGKITGVGDVKVLTRRAFEVVDALRALARAYDAYFLSVNDYNRAQFRLYRALGYPAGILACERSPGPILPVETTRPPQMAPVCAPDPVQAIRP